MKKAVEKLDVLNFRIIFAKRRAIAEVKRGSAST